MLVREIIEAAAPRADVREAADGTEALDYLRRAARPGGSPRPDLVYLDVEMPGASGHDVLAAIKSSAALREAVVVMLTGLDDEAHRRRALAAGADGYVLKPTDPRRFLEAVAESVRQWTPPEPVPSMTCEGAEDVPSV